MISNKRLQVAVLCLLVALLATVVWAALKSKTGSATLASVSSSTPNASGSVTLTATGSAKAGWTGTISGSCTGLLPNQECDIYVADRSGGQLASVAGPAYALFHTDSKGTVTFTGGTWTDKRPPGQVQVWQSVGGATGVVTELASGKIRWKK